MVSDGLAARSISAIFWGTGGAVGRMMMQFISQIVFARALGPSEFGVFAIGSLAVTFSMFFADIGLAAGLIQKANVSNNDVRFIFTWQIILGATVAAVMALLAAQIAAFFHEPRSSGVIRTLALLCLINALAAPANNLLRRNLRQRSLQVAGLVSYFVGFVLIGIPLALIYRSVWAPVVAWLVQASLAGVFAFLYTKHPVRPLIWYVDARSQGAYGLSVFLTNIVNWFVNNIDRIIIGRLLPTKEIGVYSQAYNLLYAPTSSVMGIIYPVLFSTASRSLEKTGKTHLAELYVALFSGVLLFALPAFACIAVISDTLIGALFGVAWIDAAAPCTPLALAMVPWMLYGISTPLLWVTGSRTDEIRSQLPLAFLWVVGCYIAARLFGSQGVAWALMIFMMVRWIAVARLVCRGVDIDAVRLVKAARAGVLLSICCAIFVGYFDIFLSPLSAALRLVVLFVAGTVIFAFLLRVMNRLLDPALKRLLGKTNERLPSAVRKIMYGLRICS